MVSFSMCIGSCVLLCGRAAQLSGERILFVVSIFASLLLMHFVKIFQHVSRSVMGLVMFMLCSQSFGLGIGYIVPWLHSFGVKPVVKMALKRSQRYFIDVVPSFLKTIYGIPEGPAAEKEFIFRIVSVISFGVKGVVVSLYHSGLMCSFGSNSFSHSG